MTTLVWPSEAVPESVLSTLTGPGAPFELREEPVLGAPMLVFANLLAHGLFQRFPNLRMASIETGSDWVFHLFDKLKKSYSQTPYGYPEDPRSGLRIDGIDDACGVPGVEVFHAGVARTEDGALVTAGGRVLDVVGFGATIGAARATAYDAARRISWPGIRFRSDIAREAAKP